MPDIRTRTSPITRQEWESEHGRGSLDPGPENRVVIHHSYRPALDASASPEEERAAIRGIERFHVETNGWAGIGYNWLVAPSGRIYEGRGWRFRGAHAGPVNGDSIGICLLIDGNATEPGEPLIRAVRDLIADGIALGEIAPGYVLSGHRDHMDRSCPGDRVYPRLQEFRHDADPAQPDPEIAPIHHPHPGDDDALRLDRIEIPLREHVDEITRARRLSPGAVAPGLGVAEVLLRGVAAGAGDDRKRILDGVADAIEEWRASR